MKAKSALPETQLGCRAKRNFWADFFSWIDGLPKRFSYKKR